MRYIYIYIYIYTPFIVDIKNKHVVIKKKNVNIKLCVEREKSIHDSKVLREGKGWKRGRYLECFGN